MSLRSLLCGVPIVMVCSCRVDVREDRQAPVAMRAVPS